MYMLAFSRVVEGGGDRAHYLDRQGICRRQRHGVHACFRRSCARRWWRCSRRESLLHDRQDPDEAHRRARETRRWSVSSRAARARSPPASASTRRAAERSYCALHVTYTIFYDIRVRVSTRSGLTLCSTCGAAGGACNTAWRCVRRLSLVALARGDETRREDGGQTSTRRKPRLRIIGPGAGLRHPREPRAPIPLHAPAARRASAGRRAACASYSAHAEEDVERDRRPHRRHPRPTAGSTHEPRPAQLGRIAACSVIEPAIKCVTERSLRHRCESAVPLRESGGAGRASAPPRTRFASGAAAPAGLGVGHRNVTRATGRRLTWASRAARSSDAESPSSVAAPRFFVGLRTRIAKRAQ